MANYHVQTLANSIIGTAILAMPYCFSKCGVILSILLLTISTVITRSCCHYLIKASIVSRRRNMEQLGFHMFGVAGKTMVEISVIGFLMGTCVAFYVVIGDLSPLIISKIFNIQSYSHDSVRRYLIILITVTCVIPLSFQKSIESLSFVCRASIGFYICLTLKTVFESFERFESDDNWASNIELWKPSGILQCIPIFSMAMSCQMQLFEVYETMGFPGSFDRIKRTVHHATSICCFVYCIVGFFGYLAFYNQTLSGNVLMNFRPSLANDAITIGFILSIACSFPLVIFPCRAALKSFLHPKGHHAEIAAYVPESKYQPLTLFIIFSTMILGILIPSVEVIISLVGSTIGVLVCVIFPATCFVKIMQRSSAEKTFAQLIIVVGFVIMILGTYANLTAIDSAKSGSHLEDKPSLIESRIDMPKEVENVFVKPEVPPEVTLDEKEKKENADDDLEPLVKEEKKEEPPEVKISDDSIKKEDQEIAAEESKKDPQVEIQEKNEEIQELKESKDKLEKEVLEMKEELVKQNKETQQLVLQKFDEIAEKVDKIEKQSLDSGPSAKEKVSAEVEKPEKLQQAPVVLNVAEKHDVKPINVSSEASKDKVVQKVPETVKIPDTIQNPDTVQNADSIQNPDTLQIKSNHKDTLKILGNSPEVIEKSPKLNDAKPDAPADTEPISPDHPVNIETRVDPIVKLLKSQEPLSYQVGEKMMERSKSTNSSGLPLTKLDSSENEIKNEMRKKREVFDDALSSLDKTLLNFELKSIISRDLKAVADESVDET